MENYAETSCERASRHSGSIFDENQPSKTSVNYFSLQMTIGGFSSVWLPRLLLYSHMLTRDGENHNDGDRRL